ncbi:MAG: TetR/AcrR family transcriptional regulator [Gammaproteobacteria bacterium]|nr:TetR/AcrR family transcriptional regulator [Gammaproteobacteria bacterium]
MEKLAYSTLMDLSYSRAPKQTRSRQSFDRVLDTAIEIINEGGLAALTLAEVSRRSRASIGSIYCRVDSKDALIREVQARALTEMDHEFAVLVNRVRRKGLPLRELVPAIVRELALHLKRHARALNAFMQQAGVDPVIESMGRKSWQQNALDFKLILLERHAEFRHPNPEHAAATCFTVVYGCLARYLGLGVGGHADIDSTWSELIEDLGLMALGFLLTDPSQIRQGGKPAR